MRAFDALFLLALAASTAAQATPISGRPRATRPGAARVHFVDDSALGAGNGTSWADAFVDLQEALAVALRGEEVWIAAGTYTPSASDATASFVVPSGVRLFGGFAGFETSRGQRDWTLHQSILSGDIGRDDAVGSGLFWYLSWDIGTSNSGHVVEASGVAADTVLDGLVIADGSLGPSGTPAGHELMFGGGIYALDGSPTVLHCTFRHHRAAWAAGAAVYVRGGSPTFVDCRFEENYVHSGDGAGVALVDVASALVRDCAFARNQAVAVDPSGSQGAGLYADALGTVLVERSRFEDNVCRSFYWVGNTLGYGGGIASWGPMTVRDCDFRRNQAHYGGGLVAWADARVVQSVFVDNLAVPLPNDPYPEQGGIGAGVLAYSFHPMELALEDCTVAGNRGKKHVGVATLGNDVIGPGAHITLSNSIVWGNTGTSPDVVGYFSEEIAGNFDARWSCIRAIFGPKGAGEDPIDPDNLPGCVEGNPLFAGLGSGDVHLGAGSPCTDAGKNALVPGDVIVDFDGLARFRDDPLAPDTGTGASPLVDMGAFERP